MILDLEWLPRHHSHHYHLLDYTALYLILDSTILNLKEVGYSK